EKGAVDYWGSIRIQVGEYSELVGFPLADAETIEELNEYPWPVLEKRDNFDDRVKHAKELFENTSYAVVADAPINGVFEIACAMRGYEKILMDMALKPDYVHALFKHINDIQIRAVEIYYGAVGKYIHIAQTGDDFGMQNSEFFSVDMYRDLIKPYFKKYLDAIKSYTSAKILHHTCGSVYNLIPELIDTGVDILNPIQPTAKYMEPSRLKAEFGDRLCFHGGVCMQDILPHGTPQQVKEHVKDRILGYGPRGGYIICPAHNLQGDTPPENILAMYEAIDEYGNYPLCN
ncbi:MAG: uroporphyrinogen decarboxylase family protein, partial [bacterium]